VPSIITAAALPVGVRRSNGGSSRGLTCLLLRTRVPIVRLLVCHR